MAWDFETEPEFEEQLQWMRSFIDTELIPLEPILRDLPAEEWASVKAHLQAKVKERGLWGVFLDPSLGGPGSGTAQARADVGDHRTLHDVDDDLRRPSARQWKHGAARSRCDERPEGALALAQSPGRDLERVRTDRALSRGFRSDGSRNHSNEGRR